MLSEERAKYEEVWSYQSYRKSASPGLQHVDHFIEMAMPEPGSSVIDIGCGTGEAGLALAERGFNVWWLDITSKALSPKVPRERFIEMPIWDHRWRMPTWWDYGFCCDVMEHIPTEFTMLALERVRCTCQTSFFAIALRPDEFGSLIGYPLHLTVRSFAWWRDHLAEFGLVSDARDLCGDGVYVVETCSSL